jgi:hypothetical protein
MGLLSIKCKLFLKYILFYNIIQQMHLIVKYS